MSPTIEDYQPGLADWLLRLNQANVPAVSSLDHDSLAALVEMQQALRIARIDGRPAGAIMLMRPGQPYASANYQWFCKHGASFLYIDRVMVDAGWRGRGIARVLYRDAETLARACQASRLTCEINTDPPNPGSFAFHEKLGFQGILERPSDGGKRVMMMEKLIAEHKACN